jgi:hypothetical protein
VEVSLENDWFAALYNEPSDEEAFSLCKSILGFDMFASAAAYQQPANKKRTDAITYLRERKLYCLDRKQGRIPVEERPQTLLDRWMKERHK